VDAFLSKIKDYEEAVLHESARNARVDGIATRNTNDFRPAELTIPVVLIKLSAF